MAIAQVLPEVIFANFTPLQAFGDANVTTTYASHSTYFIETPSGLSLATDDSGLCGSNPLSRIVTMNKAHHTHYSDFPDNGIEHGLRGWNLDGGPAKDALVFEDFYVRNVSVDISRFDKMERDSNSIFLFEVAGLCIGRLGYPYHWLEEAHYGGICSFMS